MTRDEITQLLEECKGLYSTYRSMYEDEKVAKEWFKTLKDYDKKDIYDNIQIHKSGNYNRQPIVLNDLVRDLETISEKESQKLENYQVFCPICDKTFPYSKFKKHEDRCRSTDFILNNYRRWLKKGVTASYWWALTDDEFDKKYEQLLNYIYNHTDNAKEKGMIACMFAQANEEENQSVIRGKNESAYKRI